MLGTSPSCAGRTLNVALLFQVEIFQLCHGMAQKSRGRESGCVEVLEEKDEVLSSATCHWLRFLT